MIQGEACRTFSISMSDLKGGKAQPEHSLPRQIAMYLCRELTDSSLPRIGEKFGGRDHTTVIHSTTIRSPKLIKEEREVLTMVQQMTSKLKHSQR